MRRTFTAMVPVEIDVPSGMEEPLRQLFAGEYEAPFFGSGLTILDIGANVGAFSIWAAMRWPGSTIHAYEPHPGTFDLLVKNVGHLAGVHPERYAVYPSDRESEPLHAEYAGDGQAGLVQSLETTWRSMPEDRILQVPVLHPRSLPRADIVKVDAEGSEGAIVEHLDLAAVALLLVEYQNLEVLDRIERATRSRFAVERHESFPWSEVLYVEEYRRELADDRYGTLVLVNRSQERLRRGAEPVPDPHAAPIAEPQARAEPPAGTDPSSDDTRGGEPPAATRPPSTSGLRRALGDLRRSRRAGGRSQR